MDGDLKADLASIKTQLQNIDKELIAIRDALDSKYVTKEEFQPVKTIVYGMVALMLTGLMLSIIALVVK